MILVPFHSYDEVLNFEFVSSWRRNEMLFTRLTLLCVESSEYEISMHEYADNH